MDADHLAVRHRDHCLYDVWLMMQFSWSETAIRTSAGLNGGVPAVRLAVVAQNGDIIVWEPTGEVRTAIKSERVVLSTQRLGE